MGRSSIFPPGTMGEGGSEAEFNALKENLTDAGRPDFRDLNFPEGGRRCRRDFVQLCEVNRLPSTFCLRWQEVVDTQVLNRRSSTIIRPMWDSLYHEANRMLRGEMTTVPPTVW